MLSVYPCGNIQPLSTVKPLFTVKPLSIVKYSLTAALHQLSDGMARKSYIGDTNRGYIHHHCSARPRQSQFDYRASYGHTARLSACGAIASANGIADNTFIQLMDEVIEYAILAAVVAALFATISLSLVARSL
jgi:hypothetical protein